MMDESDIITLRLNPKVLLLQLTRFIHFFSFLCLLDLSFTIFSHFSILAFRVSIFDSRFYYRSDRIWQKKKTNSIRDTCHPFNGQKSLKIFP